MTKKKTIAVSVICGLFLFFLPVLVTLTLGGVAGIMKWGMFEWALFALLGTGFGLQIFFFLSLRALVRSGVSTAISGTSSGAAMLACCTHYLVGVIPFLGASGFATVLAREQRSLLVAALIISVLAIIVVFRRYRNAKNMFERKTFESKEILTV